jgi:hypothetical protein
MLRCYGFGPTSLVEIDRARIILAAAEGTRRHEALNSLARQWRPNA